MASTPSIALVVPAFNEPALGTALARFAAYGASEVIVVHAGDSVTLASLRAVVLPDGVRVLKSKRGRAAQMNHGATNASADVLVFLHADTELRADALDAIRAAVAQGALWGWFDVRLSGRHPLLRVIERTMNWRARLTGIATGDQTLFVRRDAFRLLGGYADIELMEDIELCARLKTLDRPMPLTPPATSSSRRWEARGVVRTVLRMWSLRVLYALGVSPRRLARWYR